MQNGGSLNGTIEMTACSDGTGTYCCGRNELGCCGTDHAIVIPTQASVVASGGATQPPESSSNTFRNATIGLAVVLGVILVAASGVITWLLRQNKHFEKQLSEKNGEARNVPPPVVVHPFSDSDGLSSPPIKDSSAPGSPGFGFGISADHNRYSELDGSLAASRSEMGSPVPRHFDNDDVSPRTVISPSQ